MTTNRYKNTSEEALSLKGTRHVYFQILRLFLSGSFFTCYSLYFLTTTQNSSYVMIGLIGVLMVVWSVLTFMLIERAPSKIESTPMSKKIAIGIATVLAISLVIWF